jgi:hypothetical protein
MRWQSLDLDCLRRQQSFAVASLYSRIGQHAGQIGRVDLKEHLAGATGSASAFDDMSKNNFQLREGLQFMGYLITAHCFRENPNLSQLAGLPKSIGYRVYLYRSLNLYLLDTFRPTRIPQYPFTALLPSADIPLELPTELAILEKLYSQLFQLKLADSFKKSYINFAILISRILQTPILSFATDDDGLDFTCSVENGALSSLKCRCEDLLITFNNNKLQIAPLILDDVEDENLLTDTNSLQIAVHEAHVLPRETPWNSELHAVAIEHFKKFTGYNQTILGMGSFDPPEDDSELQLIASR